ncbi:4-hydroxyphenylacetate 3-hydroxylase family protein [Nonomuraea guangzhouensis]|uniref:4-hydroxyphenylacetate 3-hydroxylase family protein n=1 Tax=Nonomuraea guangzhouensis TaxID=1291555 RepID=A0ABW4GC54_9ACTN|nr:4-hydroxyphenylacetate 3-hydroxylase N-terminal domain-containing protein [Nonomuraea guangzhouensis]
MLKTGKEHLDSLRDGRVVFVGKERIDDVTTHPAFRRAAQTIADLYDLKADPAHRDVMTYVDDDGVRASAYFMRARTSEQLAQRSAAHKKIADMSHGLLGRAPDYIASFVTGMSICPEVFGDRADNVTAYWRYMRDNDVYAAHAIVAPQAARDPAYYERENRPIPTLRVISEDDDGVVVHGMKMLATGAILANDIFIGNILPLAPENKAESITLVVRCNAPGVSLWSRKPLEPTATSEFDSPLTWRFDETDAMVMFDHVKVPWEQVFVHNDVALSRELYFRTPAHVYGNHHSNVRFLAKLQLIIGLASRVTESTGAAQVPAVRETLGRMASQEALLSGLIDGQMWAAESWGEYVAFNRRSMYAALNWCVEEYSPLIDTLRELCGGGVLQMPADASVLEDPELSEVFREFWHTPQLDAVNRMKLLKLAWDMVGSEFAGRHLQYEKFYPGARFIVRGHNYREAPWDEFHRVVDELMGSYTYPAAVVRG